MLGLAVEEEAVSNDDEGEETSDTDIVKLLRERRNHTHKVVNNDVKSLPQRHINKEEKGGHEQIMVGT